MRNSARGMNYIGGRWVSARTEETFEDRSPADTRKRLGVFPRSGNQEAEAAVQAAREAYPKWSRMSKIKRAEYLDTFAQLVKPLTEELAQLMAQECGKALNESRADVVEGLHTAQYWFGRARMNLGEVLASEIAEKESYVMRHPKGVVACISPWNFPFAIPLWLICPSLVEGNTVVLKPAEETPMMAQRLVELFEMAGLPPGVLNLVHGYGEEAGWPLATHPDVNAVLFTGSYDVGSRIRQEAARDFDKFVVTEMGGKNAIIVFDDADFDLAVNAAVLSAFKTTGQRCVSASRLIVQEGVFDKFVQAFTERAGRLKIGDPLAQDTFMGPLVSQTGLDKVLSYNKLAKQEDAQVLLDGGRLEGKEHRHGYFASPFVYVMKHGPQRVLREEVFGPHVALIPFKDLEEAVHIYNDCDYGFAMSVCSRDYRKIRQVREECRFGVGYVNLPTIGAEVHLPFGGLKKSGSGMPSAAALADAVTHRYSWTINHADEIILAQGLQAQVP
ncbi:MAG TPA: aldehyde dehydrogenase family protein [Dehalococcoidia bacterium]|nr:aldehyde dehydrogenase family protein [Dehalococcoidia bacterium]